MTPTRGLAAEDAARGAVPALRTALAAGLAGTVVLLAACSGPSAPRPEPPPRATVGAPAGGRPHEPARPDGDVVTLAFAGDVHFQLQLAAMLQHPATGLGRLDRLLGDADVTMLNLESAITERGSPAAKELEDPADRYWYRTSPAALDLLAAAGVDVVSVANNHGADYGAVGLRDTVRAAARAPLAVVGVGRDRRAAFTPYRVTVRGTRLAFLAADASYLESASSEWRAGLGTPGLAAAHGPRPATLLRAVRRAARRADAVVVYLHWGTPMRACPTSLQRRAAHALSDAGAAVVVGAHSHVLEGAGWLDADTYVGYGLGNAVWYHDHHPDGGVLRLGLRDGRVVSDRWRPALVPPGGGAAVPLRGETARHAVARWRALRACAGLRDRPDPGDASYRPSVHRIGAALRHRMAASHPPGCPVPWRDLRLLRLGYVGLDGRTHRGRIVVGAAYAADVVEVFRTLFEARWPIRRMVTVDRFGGDDERSMAADNTSGFNCRTVAGTHRWSDHAYGAAVDLNPRENPVVQDGRVRPPGAERLTIVDRAPGARTPAGVIGADDVVVRAFARVGWEWGGTWREPDYQHFAAAR